MSKKENYQNLASHFIDLWQEQITTMMNDPEFIRGLLQMMQAMNFSVKEPFNYAPTFHTPPVGSSAAPDARDAAMVRIERSLAAIEKRLGTLESLRRPGRKTSKSMAGNAKRSKARASGHGRGKKKGK